jgi:hypothetical protein
MNDARLITLHAQRNADASVSIYRDAQRAALFVRIDKHNSARPRRGQKRITLNCYRWKLEWLPEVLPRFRVNNGATCTLAELVKVNAEDAALCAWASTAAIGDHFPDGEGCTRIA